MADGEAGDTPGTQVGEGPRTVLFEFDGVLIHGDAFALFVRHRHRQWGRRLLALMALPWLLAGLPFSRRRPLRTLAHIGLLGLDERRYRVAVEAFADQLARKPGQFCRDGLQALRRHQVAGDRVIVVTGCEYALASRLLHQLGLTDVEVVASALRAGRLGMRVQLHNIGTAKLQSLSGQGVTRWDVAYGGSMNDAAILKAAAEPVLVNADPKLCKQVERALGRPVKRVAWH